MVKAVQQFPSVTQHVAFAPPTKECCGANPAAVPGKKAATQGPPPVFQQQEFGKHMYCATWSSEAEGWSCGELVAYGPISMDPHAQVLNYGQSIFEGLRAYKSASKALVLFRPELNAARFAEGAARMCMPAVPEDMFVRAVEQVVRANASQIPECGKGSLYVRPLLLGTGGLVGLGPAPSYTFLVYTLPSGSRLKDGKMVPVRLRVEYRIHRAAPRGNGATKAAGNYSQVLVAQQAARAEGYADVIYLDARDDTHLEEGSGFNIFTVCGNRLRTPAAKGTILDGVTRRSVMQLARDAGMEVEEGPITVDEALEADELFATGTAVVIMAVSALTYKEREKQYTTPDQAGPVTQKLYTALTAIQNGTGPDPHGWVHVVPDADVVQEINGKLNGNGRHYDLNGNGKHHE